MYDSRVAGIKGTRLAIFKADGITPAVKGEDYNEGHNLIKEDIFYDGAQSTAITKRF
jgi:hypothetical protein